jgi:serine protease Do
MSPLLHHRTAFAPSTGLSRSSWVGRAVWACAVLAVGLLLAALPSAGRSAEDPARAGAPDVTPAFDFGDRTRFTSAIVRVDCSVPQEATTVRTLGTRRQGSGVVIGPQVVLTIGYLLVEAEQVMVTTASGRRIPGSVAGYDHATGYGLVRTALPMDGLALALGDSDAITERQTVLTQGQGESEATELVVVSRKTFVASWEYLLERPIYTFPPVSNWSGSALIDREGRLVGIGSLVVEDAATDRSVPGNLFVPVNLLKPILADLIAMGHRASPVQPWLGITLQPRAGALAVVRVFRDGPADSAGIEAGDVVVGVGAEPVVDLAEFYRQVWRQGPAGTEVTLSVSREGMLREVRVRSVDRMDVLRKPQGI